MQLLYNTENIRTIEQHTITQVGIPAVVLMEKAAMAVTAIMLEQLEQRERVLVVCGLGNNAGDGAAVARLLWCQGIQVSILLVGDEMKASELLKEQLCMVRKIGVPILADADLTEYDVFVDALFGIGLSRPIEGAFADWIRRINQRKGMVFAVDVPSGVDIDTGRIKGVAIRADFTVTFGMNKLGLCVYPGCTYAGKVIVADIGFPECSICEGKSQTFIFDSADVKRMLPRRIGNSHKGTYGKVLIIAGSKNMCGACFLSAKAAYRSGAGLVRVLTVEENRSIMQASLPEAILTTYEHDGLANFMTQTEIVQAIDWADSIVIGPGMGVTENTTQLLELVNQRAKVPVVIDADAINVLAREPMKLAPQVILTPHIKEMSRLAQCEVATILENPLEFADSFAKSSTAVLVLKDARTVVSDGVRIYINQSGNHGMATGGSGDVLTGILGGLLAQGLALYEAATLGVYVHGLAGDFCTQTGNAYSVMAGDLVEALKKVLQ